MGINGIIWITNTNESAPFRLCERRRDQRCHVLDFELFLRAVKGCPG